MQLRPLFQVVALLTSRLSLPHCRLNDGSPVAPLRDATVHAQLGMITVGKIDAAFIRVLVKLNAVKLPDEEALQQNNSATSAMRVKRSFDCLLSRGSEPSGEAACGRACFCRELDVARS